MPNTRFGHVESRVRHDRGADGRHALPRRDPVDAAHRAARLTADRLEAPGPGGGAHPAVLSDGRQGDSPDVSDARKEVWGRGGGGGFPGGATGGGVGGGGRGGRGGRGAARVVVGGERKDPPRRSDGSVRGVPALNSGNREGAAGA